MDMAHPQLLLHVVSIHLRVDLQILVPSAGERWPGHWNLGLPLVGVSERVKGRVAQLMIVIMRQACQSGNKKITIVRMLFNCTTSLKDVGCWDNTASN